MLIVRGRSFATSSDKTGEQGFGILFVTSLARIVGAQSHATDARQSLRGGPRVALRIARLPEVFVELAAVQFGLLLGQRLAEEKPGDCKHERCRQRAGSGHKRPT